MNLKPVKTIAHLSQLAHEQEDYAKLAISSAINLGGDPKSIHEAIKWLNTMVEETGNPDTGEYNEDGVVEEINSIIPFLLDREIFPPTTMSGS